MFRRDDKNIPIGYIYPKLVQTMTNAMFFKKNLEVFIPSEADLEQSVQNLMFLYSQRTRQNHEFWLVDISAWPSLEEALSDLKPLPLDFDDNFYIYSFLDHFGSIFLTASSNSISLSSVRSVKSCSLHS